MNAASRPIAIAPRPIVWADPQPLPAASTIVYTASISEPVINTAPAKSAPSPKPIPRSRSIRRTANAAVAIPIGRLTKKIQCQLIASVSTPPRIRPIEAPPAATKLYTPMAFACSAGFGNIVTIIPRITAELRAPPIPCRNRAPISISWLCATPHSSEASVNTPSPAMNTPLRLTRSPSLPASKSRPPNGIRYAFTTHARSDCEKPRSSWIEGRATLTIVWSRMIISIPTQSTINAVHRARSFIGLVPWPIAVAISDICPPDNIRSRSNKDRSKSSRTRSSCTDAL